ncbi:helix-turn-helix domain-containing protein [Streptomyces sp. JJ66]|uniref:helix-turn-helix domain-containing protein n=1 Tax=Streptomyces sp. JJ66 TaxID=2803843 RepID=UPI0027E3999A|nr:helix-turn-helix domain-containing protein [Streptomyces sp. JJ66]
MKARHTERFTVVGNHLAQHRELSATAIGLAVHIQSLPEGARVDIKSLASRFREGETRVAAALRELERHGYLVRSRHRTAAGRIVTRTVCHHRPGQGSGSTAGPRSGQVAGRQLGRGAGHRSGSASAPAPGCVPPPLPAPRRAPCAPARVARSGPATVVTPPVAVPPLGTPPDASPSDAARSGSAAPGAASAEAGTPAGVGAGRVPASPLPAPRTANLGRHRIAADLLIGLHRADPRLLLSERDVRRLTPAVAAWLERGAASETVRVALVTGLPDPLRHPAALLAHRLTALLPPPRAAAPPSAPRPDPLQNCDGCDRAYRAPTPGGRCRDCRTGA